MSLRVLVVGPASGHVAEAVAAAAAGGTAIRREPDPERALAALRAGGVDLVLVDVAVGIAAFVRALRGERMLVPVVAFGTGSDARAAADAIRAGAADFLSLPPDAELVRAIIESLAGTDREIVAEDPVMLACLERAKLFAPAEAAVLLTGESGTGKEVVARFLHRHSRRADGPFVTVNCAAIPDPLLESELFGHEKGAFTGAVARRIGRFEEASGGTLLLDEISEMDARLQAKLLRALQEREIDRVGGSRPVPVDIRVIATSNRDLLKEVEAGRFRQDLYFRLAVLHLELPPLRERPRDIAPLARHFARRYARLNGLPERLPDPAAVARLESHDWPGNVRELENCMHRAVLLATGDAIGPEAIVFDSRRGPAPSPSPAAAAPLACRPLADIEREVILETLRRTDGNRTRAAELLGISIRTLRNRLRQYAQEGVAIPPARS
ncbi:Transcriptional regulatory protein ZraR [bacterium HR39]|nr:Transcriptional regulatory protein ZraR [bacterium HR39]